MVFYKYNVCVSKSQGKSLPFYMGIGLLQGGVLEPKLWNIG